VRVVSSLSRYIHFYALPSDLYQKLASIAAENSAYWFALRKHLRLTRSPIAN
jgi:hypothetical protein